MTFDNKHTSSNTQIAAELARQIMSGDTTAENEFVRLNHSWLLFIVRRQFPQSSHHEDILQDAFMLVLSKLKQGAINKPESIVSFLRTTAINIGYEYLKKDKKFTSAIDQNYIDFIQDTNDGILSKIIWNDKLNYVQQVIQELRKQRDKDILMGFYFHNKSKNTICENSNLTAEHFDRVIYRAKQRLKELINNTGNDDARNNDSKQRVKSKASKNIRNLLQSMVFKVVKFNWGAA